MGDIFVSAILRNYRGISQKNIKLANEQKEFSSSSNNVFFIKHGKLTARKTTEDKLFFLITLSGHVVLSIAFDMGVLMAYCFFFCKKSNN